MNYSKITGHSNLIRDDKNQAVINTNMSDYNAYILQKNLKEKENLKIQSLEENVANMKSDLDEIKGLLRSLLNEPR